MDKGGGMRIAVLGAAEDPRVQALLRRSIAHDPALELVGTAESGEQAVALAACLRPDVVALDLSLGGEQPGELIRRLKGAAESAVVAMGSASPALDALDSGADDFLPVPLGGSDSDNSTFLHDTVNRIKVATAGRRAFAPPGGAPLELIVAAGSSGGPAPLAALLARLGRPCPPVVAALHGSALFGDVPAQLRVMTGREVVVVADATPLCPGCIHLAAPGRHIAVESIDGQRFAVARRSPPRCGRLPSADVLFRSTVRSGCAGAAGVLLCEGGRDGRDGLQSLRRNGALAYARDEHAGLRDSPESAVGGVRRMALDDIARELAGLCE